MFAYTAATAAESLQSCPTLCDPIDSSPAGSLSLGFSRQEYWSGLPLPSLASCPKKFNFACVYFSFSSTTTTFHRKLPQSFCDSTDNLISLDISLGSDNLPY